MKSFDKIRFSTLSAFSLKFIERKEKSFVKKYGSFSTKWHIDMFHLYIGLDPGQMHKNLYTF